MSATTSTTTTAKTPELELQRIEWRGIKKLSPEIADKGEAFVTAMIAAGHSYGEMKGIFIASVVRTWLKQVNGNVMAAAKKMGVQRDWFYLLLKRLNMHKELEEIRRAGESQ